MSKHSPVYSIVIPCYNESQLIARNLESLRAQNFDKEYEIIIVDNNCTDDTVSIAKSYGARIISEPTVGVCWARQAGTMAAKGDIVISTDGDTYFGKNWLRNIDAKFNKYKKCVAVAGPCKYSDGPWWGQQYPRILFGAVSFFYHLIGKPFYITATNIAFKKSAWIGYDTSLTQGGDELDLLHNLRKEGRVVFNYNNPVFTSGRRLYKGLFYNIFVTFLTYYLLAYYLDKIFGRTIIGNAPTIRSIVPSNKKWLALYRFTFVSFVVVFVHLPGKDTVLQQSYETVSSVKKVLQEYV